MKLKLLSDFRKSPLPMFAYMLLLFGLLRVSFHAINHSQFDGATNTSQAYFYSYFFGLKLDAIATFYLILIPFWVLSVVKYKSIRNTITTILASIPIIIAAIDSQYFKFSKERLGLDFNQFLQSNNNISLQSYLQDYWVLLILVIVLIGSSAFILHKISPKSTNSRAIGINILVFAILFFLVRGGFRSRPLRSVDASNTVAQPLIPLGLNPTLLIAESMLNRNPDTHLTDLPEIQPELQNFKSDSFLKMNVVIVVLESFGKEYTGLNHNYTHNYTPFLNKLMKESLVFTDAYANGLKSMDAVPAIFCGIPRIQSSAAINSPQAMKPVSSIMRKLETAGYQSLFFHGADNNSMGFRSYLKAQGLDNYYGIDEYPNTAQDSDGKWGIYDGPFLQYVARKLNDTQKPFLAGVFTLSSHHPYLVPPKYKNRFPKGNLKIHESVGYTDFALDSFFQTCSRMPWFKNTLFVITADHSSENALHAYRTPSGKYEIPLLFYAPGIVTPKEISKTVSQIDIIPTILDILNFPENVSILGKSGLNFTEPGVVCHYDNGHFHITSEGWNLGINSQKPVFLYNKIIDPNCLKNVVNQFPDTITTLTHLLNKFGSEFKSISN